MQQQVDQRWHGLDAVRGLALVAGVVLHSAMAYLPGPPMWLVDDVNHSTALSVAFFTIHMARMTVFFVLAGFFARLVFHRAGTVQFLRNRAMRIAVPLVLFWPVVWFAILLAMGAATPGDGSIPKLTAATFPLTHLWFLYVLCWLYVGALLVRGVVAVADRREGIRNGVDAVVRVIMWPWSPLLLALPVAWALYSHGYWFMWFGVPTPDTGLLPNRAAMVTYGLAFAMGWLIHRQAGLVLPRLQRQYAVYLLIAVAATVYCLGTTSLSPLLAPAPFGPSKVQFAAAYAIGLWSWAFALIGLGLRFLNDPSPARRYLADASYWIYIVHLPLVAALQLLVHTWPIPAAVKFVGILAVAMTLLLFSYHYLVRSTMIGALLNGRRYPRGTASTPQGTTLMKTLPLLLLLPTLLSAQRVAAPAPLPIDTVIARHLRAIGPIERITTRRVSMRVTGMAPFEIPVVSEAMRPNLLLKKVNLQGAEQLTGFDGREAWRVDPFASASKKATDVPAAELADFMEETDFDGPLVNPAAKGNRLRYVGPRVVTVAGVQVPVHALELTLANGRQAVLHLHGTSYLEVSRTQSRDIMGSNVAMTITPSDYRTVQGVKVPYAMEIAIAGMPAPIRIVIDKVEMNVPMDRRQFGKP